MLNFNPLVVSEWLDYLENRHRQEIKLGLPRIKLFAENLDLLQWKIPVITVGGTNGKGSTIAALEAIYSAAGCRVASYTSPHLMRFNERIKINQKPITDDDLCAAFSFIHKEEREKVLTYFEFATLAALWHFKHSAPDILLLEVGLGGRKDATNIIDSDLAIITTVDLDHQAFLGDTKEAIGYEKAGILRENRQLIYADENPPESVLDCAKRLSVDMYQLTRDYSFHIKQKELTLSLQSKPLCTIPLPRINPKAASAAVLASYLLQQKIPVEKDNLIQAMHSVHILGRQQLIVNPKLTVLDVAHNQQAAKLLAHFVSSFQSKKRVHAVFAALKDKDILGLIEPLYNLVTFWYPSMLPGKRASDKETLLNKFAQLNLKIDLYESPEVAYHHACKNVEEGDLIIVYGSFLTVSAVMGTITGEERK